MDEGVDALSEREKATLRLLLAGHDAKSIARHLDLSVHTINERLRDARRKLGVSSSREAARHLGRAEGGDPQFPVPMDLGVAPLPLPPQQPEPHRQPKGAGHVAAWLAGGIVMLCLIAVALFSFGRGEDIPSTPASATPASAIPTASGPAASGRAATQWLALVDKGDWSGSWRASGTLFQSQVTTQGWASVIEPVRKPLGAVLSRTLGKVTKATSLPGAPTGHYELLEYRTTFANKPAAVETIVLAQQSSGWKVVGYFIR
ncbi:DUF4019 domain-containing protein [Sphingobium sufflavum]|uniref:helix-turn-helix domain-containing protein n=1 Tax=Sphingobium sufflavum TaxID=1129547 RepID=UPI001F199BBE|nr:DUF4019 domain-containing protein [Sphingobium sufflavum]MCE7797391.1 DUF4019 domain-containing protein [Sphingobium sufflavum]